MSLDLHLSKLIEDFVSGRNQTISIAREIEVLIEKNFPDDPFVQDDIVEALARYSPVGGEYLYKADYISTLLSSFLDTHSTS